MGVQLNCVAAEQVLQLKVVLMLPNGRHDCWCCLRPLVLLERNAWEITLISVRLKWQLHHLRDSRLETSDEIYGELQVSLKIIAIFLHAAILMHVKCRKENIAFSRVSLRNSVELFCCLTHVAIFWHCIKIM